MAETQKNQMKTTKVLLHKGKEIEHKINKVNKFI